MWSRRLSLARDPVYNWSQDGMGQMTSCGCLGDIVAISYKERWDIWEGDLKLCLETYKLELIPMRRLSAQRASLSIYAQSSTPFGHLRGTASPY